MREQEYRFLCEACDRILLEQPMRLERLSLSWLHVIREHPVLLARYERLFAGPLKSLSAWMGSKRILTEVLRRLRQFSRALRHKPVVGLFGNADLLFVSHYINTAQVQADTDFYFGTLPTELAEQGLRVVVALIDHTSSSSTQARFLPQTPNLLRVVLPNTLDLSDELGMVRAMYGLASDLTKTKESSVLAGNIRLAAAAEALADSTFQAHRIARQIASLVEQLDPRVLVTTYEGHAWERAVFFAARRAHVGIKCIAYQHAALFRLQHAIRRSLGDGADPDAIWTSGNVALEQLRALPAMKDMQISELGSPRAPLKSTATDNPPRVPFGEAFTCLVLPEGLFSECETLFEFSLACAAVYPQAEFVWRLHPIISFESLVQRNPRFRDLPSNVRVSKLPISVDLAQSNCVLYRGSTAVIQAVLEGVIPVYVKLDNEISIDPLFDVEDGVGRISSPGCLLSAVEEACMGAKHTVVREHCRRMFTPLRSGLEVVGMLGFNR
jgi:hypothetical protein